MQNNYLKFNKKHKKTSKYRLKPLKEPKKVLEKARKTNICVDKWEKDAIIST